MKYGEFKEGLASQCRYCGISVDKRENLDENGAISINNGGDRQEGKTAFRDRKN